MAQRQLGNFPQAFSHIGLINSAHALVSAAGGVWELADLDGKALSKKTAPKAAPKRDGKKDAAQAAGSANSSALNTVWKTVPSNISNSFFETSRFMANG